MPIAKKWFDSKTWKLLCSLKLTIILASVATLLAIGGSLLMPFNPQAFSGIEEQPLGPWLQQQEQTALTWWIPFGGGLVVLLGINTLCCFIDWLCHIRARWRKCGEYLIHLGFILVLSAFLWGSHTGFRSSGNGLRVGQSKLLPRPGVYLKLEAVEPIFNRNGRPIEIRNTLALYRGEQLLKRVQTRSNHPLTWHGLLVIPTSFGQTIWGGRPTPYSILTINYDPGANLAFAGSLCMGTGVLLTLISFYRKRARSDRPDIA